MIRMMTSAIALMTTLVSTNAANAQASSPEDSWWNLRMIGAQAAADRGYTGSGVLVGVFDSGVDAGHRDFVGRLTGSYDVYTGGGVFDDPDGHGTHVAGIIAAARDGVDSRGVAYGARIALYRLADGADYQQDDALTALAYDHAIANGVRIFNNSWGWDFYIGSTLGRQAYEQLMTAQTAAYRRAVASDAILVWSTGNEQRLQPNNHAGLPYYVPELQANWLAVTAVGRDGTLASYANHCGLAAQWCLAAPGGDFPVPGQTTADSFIVSSRVGGGATALAGTSMAAPHVTGAVAIAREMFPDARGSELVRLVLTTAVDIGAPGVDSVYGWGLLSVGNLATTRDPVTASLFPNAAWAADGARDARMDGLRSRLSSGAQAGAWVSAHGARDRHDSTVTDLGEGARQARADTGGLVAGYDRQFDQGVRIGLAFGAGRTDLNEVGTLNRARIETLSLTGYATQQRDALFLELAGGAELDQYRFRRGTIAGAGGTVLANRGVAGQSTSDGLGLFLDGRLGWSFQMGDNALRPYIQARADHRRIDALGEGDSADVFGLDVADIELTRYRAGPGLEWLWTADRPSGALQADVGVRRDFAWGDDHAATATLLGQPIRAHIDDLGDMTVMTAGLRAELAPDLTLSARAGHGVGDRQTASTVSLGLRLAF